MWARQGSNLRPKGYEPPALPLSYRPGCSRAGTQFYDETGRPVCTYSTSTIIHDRTGDVVGANPGSGGPFVGLEWRAEGRS